MDFTKLTPDEFMELPAEQRNQILREMMKVATEKLNTMAQLSSHGRNGSPIFAAFGVAHVQMGVN